MKRYEKEWQQIFKAAGLSKEIERIDNLIKDIKKV